VQLVVARFVGLTIVLELARQRVLEGQRALLHIEVVHHVQ
jgi:hypothetical protein